MSRSSSLSSKDRSSGTERKINQIEQPNYRPREQLGNVWSGEDGPWTVPATRHMGI